MNFGESCFGEVAFATVPDAIGVPIIAEVVSLTRELVLVFEIDAIQPTMSEEE